MSNGLRLLLCPLLFLSAHTVHSQALVRYTLFLSNPEQHTVHVAMELPPGHKSHELQLPVWNALYQIRDFSQYMTWIRARDTKGYSLRVTQLNKSRWQVSGTQDGAQVEYETFADNPGAYGAQLNRRHAFFNLAEILLYTDDMRTAATQVRFENLPEQWKIATPLSQSGEYYHAENYDRLVDAPVEIGTFDERDFTAACGKYRVVVDADSATQILAKIVPPIQRIVAAATNWMNDCPFETYTFIYHFSDVPGEGGMEHAYSTAISLGAKDVVDGLDRVLGITAHEFFHLWNVKRIRPQSLEPVDYTKENYTTVLWFSEGVDSTVSQYIQLRAGLLNEQQYLKHLSEEITELENRPAHLTQSVEESSEDAWLEKYSAYSLPQRSISYYNKGELLGILLDLEMRRRSYNQISLRELFQWMNEHYAKPGEYFADSKGVEEAAELLTHSDFHEFFAKYVAGVEEMRWDDLFAPVGLRITKSEVVFPAPGFDAVQKFDQPPIVVEVYPGTEAENAGVVSGDVILQLNGQPAGRDFSKQVAKLIPGEKLTLVIRHEGGQKTVSLKLGSRRRTVYQLVDLPAVTSQEKALRADWLFGGTGR